MYAHMQAHTRTRTHAHAQTDKCTAVQTTWSTMRWWTCCAVMCMGCGRWLDGGQVCGIGWRGHWMTRQIWQSIRVECNLARDLLAAITAACCTVPSLPVTGLAKLQQSNGSMSNWKCVLSQLTDEHCKKVYFACTCLARSCYKVLLA